MNLFQKLLMFPSARMKVDSSLLPAFRDFLLSELRGREFEKSDMLTEQLLNRLVTEAYRMAAENEDDGIARNARMYQAVEAIAEQTVIAYRNPSQATPFLRGILIHNNIHGDHL